MIGREPRILRPSRTSPGTVPAPKSSFEVTFWVTGGTSMRRYPIRLSWSARSTHAHGCDAGTA
jgi:hypothetical protein